jgi:glycosyltransferase involved in cell wall biosynthesis
MYDVEIVMPVYNEAACINEVLDDWIRELDLFGISYRLLVLNDGSRDNTAEVLARYHKNPKVEIINKQNSGHGPTILQGYHIAAQEASWVLQVDSDNEIKAGHFITLWRARKKYDAVIGIRTNRRQPLSRKIISLFSRLVVLLFYESGIDDVNCPFRLMRSEVLKDILKKIPDNTFAPNVAISGLLALTKARILNMAVPHSNRQTGEVSIKRWRLAKASMRSFLQIVKIRYSTIPLISD